MNYRKPIISILIIALSFSNAVSAFAIYELPKPLEIVSANKVGNISSVEVKNNANQDIDISGYELISEASSMLNPKKGTEAFIIPEGYSVTFTNNVYTYEKEQTTKDNTVLIELPTLEINSKSGKVELLDNLGGTVDDFFYKITDEDMKVIFKTQGNNIDKSYDDVDAVFLGLDPTDISKETEMPKNIDLISTISEPIKISSPISITDTPSEENNPVTGYTISYVLISIILAFFLFKYHQRMQDVIR